MQKIDIKKIVLNDGQIEGVPKNPRQWKKGQIEKLAASIEQTPELFDFRPIIAFDNVDNYIALGGNMRLAAAQYLKWKEVPCEIVSRETSISKLKEIVIKDNSTFGEWDFDALANEWDELPLNDWGCPTKCETPLRDLAEIEPEYKIEISCSNEEEQERLYNRLTEEGMTCRILIL